MAVKVLLVEEHPAVRVARRRWLERADGVKVVGEAEPGPPVLALIKLADPQVVLIDADGAPDSGFELARMITTHYPELPVLMLGNTTDGRVRAGAARAGAWGCLPKSGRPEDAARMIRSVVGGTGKRIIDVSDAPSQRPMTEGFIALPDSKHKSKRKPPVRVPPVEVPDSPPATLELAASAPVAAVPAEPSVRLPVLPKAPAAPPPGTSVTPIREARSPAPTPVQKKKRGGRAPASERAILPNPVRAVPPPPAPARKSPPPPATSQFNLSWTPPQSKNGSRRNRSGNTTPPLEISYRGPTGLPRRTGGHR